MTTDVNAARNSASAIGVVGAPSGPRATNAAALTIEQLARALGQSLETVRRHIADGAPTGADGTVNLVQYAAWLNKRLRDNDGD